MGIKMIKQTSISILIVALCMSWYVVPSIAQGPGPKAYGSATAFDNNGDLFRFHFGVRIDDDGLARGQWTLITENQKLKTDAELNCLYVNGNRASIGGVVTHSENPMVEVGTEFIFVVIDGGRNDIDRVSPVCLGNDCTDLDSINSCDTLLESHRGNVRVFNPYQLP